MRIINKTPRPNVARRAFLRWSAGALAGVMASTNESRQFVVRADDKQSAPTLEKPARHHTKFQLACMTLPYSQFPLQRALSGIKSAGFEFVAWGTTHRDDTGKSTPVISPDASPQHAQELSRRCRDQGLEPLMMFSGVYPEAEGAVEIFGQRIRQASAAKIPQLLTFGHTKGGNRKLWLERFRQLAPMARDLGVLIVVKQHGGETGTGTACAEFTRELADENVKVNYDAGNVLDYLNVQPTSDIRQCADEIRSFCIKDHRNFPKDEDCGPGFGEIDHYQLLHSVAFTERVIPLCCENISAPLVPRPTNPDAVDKLARRAREFLETVIAGLHSLS